MFDRIELGAQRAIDHPAAELHDQPADDRRVDLHVDLHVLLGDCVERGLDGVEVLLARTASVTSALTSPLCSATSLRNALMMSCTANRRLFADTTWRKRPASPPMPAFSSTAASARDCASAVKAGLRPRRRRSALSPISASKRSRSALTASIARSSSASSNSAVA